jgi:transforming growth factor-beta-induced protein
LVFILLFTAVFAPTNAAFAKLPAALVYYLSQEDNVGKLASILTNHVANGETFSGALVNGMTVTTLGGTLDVSIMGDTIKIGEATVTMPDVDVSNGVIHVIDSVLVPATFTFPSLVDALGTSEFTFATLIAAVVRAELADTLSGPGPFTVFAPTDAGFDTLPAGAVKDLTTDEDKTPLQDILKYHVVPELITAEAILAGLTSATTLQDIDLTFSVMDGTVMVNGTPVLGSEIAGNGIAHAIGAVLSPPAATTGAPTPAPNMAPTGSEDDGALSMSTFVAALVSAAALLMF